MDKMYLFKNENEVTEYDGSPLRFYVGKKLIKQIFSPTEDELNDFGYKYIIASSIPEYDAETQYLTKKYADGENITETYEVRDIPAETEITEETEETEE